MTQGLHLILGDDEFLVERATRSIIAAHREAAPDPTQPPGVEKLSGADVTSGQLLELLSPPLFGEERVVVIEQAANLGKDPQAAVSSAATDLDAGTVLVVQHSGGGRAKNLVPALTKAGAQTHEAKKLRNNEYGGFVRGEFRSHGVRVSQEVADLLVDAVGRDLRGLAAAADQLVSDTGGRVDAEAVRRYHTGIVGVSGFAVADSAVAGRTAEAIENLRWALNTGESPVAMAEALATSVHRLSQVGARPDARPGDFIQMGLRDWQVKKIRTTLRAWDADRIGRALRVVSTLSGDLKGRDVGRAEDPAYAVERAVRTIGALAAP